MIVQPAAPAPRRRRLLSRFVVRAARTIWTVRTVVCKKGPAEEFLPAHTAVIQTSGGVVPGDAV